MRRSPVRQDEYDRFFVLIADYCLSAQSNVLGLCFGAVEQEKIGVAELENKLARFVQFPTQKDRRLIVELKDGSRRLVQCEKCAKTDGLEVRPDSSRFANYLIICRNDSTRLFITIKPEEAS